MRSFLLNKLVRDKILADMQAINPTLPVKLQVDVSIGQNWGEL
jgi:DNA polymerase I-like protein with 3'-5' exonuclease and polymerase domains